MPWSKPFQNPDVWRKTAEGTKNEKVIRGYDIVGYKSRWWRSRRVNDNEKEYKPAMIMNILEHFRYFIGCCKELARTKNIKTDAYNRVK